LIIFVFFSEKNRFDRTELQNELNMMHSSDEGIELCSFDRFDRTEPNFLRKKYKNNQKGWSAVRRDELAFNLLRFGKRLTFNCFTVMKVLNYVRLIDSIEPNRTFYKKDKKFV
jgi:pyruvate/2-oxoglutarate dehydrogenase complex dihydrolipoamide acyltransferase (E2) component